MLGSLPPRSVQRAPVPCWPRPERVVGPSVLPPGPLSAVGLPSWPRDGRGCGWGAGGGWSAPSGGGLSWPVRE
eukprot:1892936-Alexandrium_andersonii.AAC.1